MAKKKSSTDKTPPVVLGDTFYFPEQEKSVVATSLEEAKKMLDKQDEEK